MKAKTCFRMVPRRAAIDDRDNLPLNTAIAATFAIPPRTPQNSKDGPSTAARRPRAGRKRGRVTTTTPAPAEGADLSALETCGGAARTRRRPAAGRAEGGPERRRPRRRSAPSVASAASTVESSIAGSEQEVIGAERDPAG